MMGSQVITEEGTGIESIAGIFVVFLLGGVGKIGTPWRLGMATGFLIKRLKGLGEILQRVAIQIIVQGDFKGAECISFWEGGFF
jgi:hypothetical protein